QYRHEEVVDMKQVKEKLADDTAILIDSRSRDRYLGKTEPMHPKAGHIPGAKNMFWKGVLDADGHWKNVDELKEHFADLPKDEEIIVSCGSGVSATPNIMGLKMAGFKNIKLYTGSYSDWISYDENELETKEEYTVTKKRCDWVTIDPIYIDYHDHEWGRPTYDDQKLFEMVSLEGAQAGLSWITILKRRENYRDAFDQFDPGKVSQYDDRKIAALLQNKGIIRNKRKIKSVVTNARAFLRVQEEFGSFAAYIWRFVGGRPMLNDWATHADVPASTA